MARPIGFDAPLAVKGKSGILQSARTRQGFVRDLRRPIVVHFTPKHCSWINQIRMWFSILARKVIRHGDLKSPKDLAAKIECFIEYFNATIANPIPCTSQNTPPAT